MRRCAIAGGVLDTRGHKIEARGLRGSPVARKPRLQERGRVAEREAVGPLPP